MKISDAAKLLDIPISTIRFYERKNVIPAPLKSGTSRVFTSRDLKILKFVRNAQSVGFSLADIGALVNASSNSQNRTSGYSTRVAELADRHRVAIRKQIASLSEMDRVLESLQGCGCADFSQCLSENVEFDVKETTDV